MKWPNGCDILIALSRTQIDKLSDGKEKRDYERLQQAINFTLDCGDWITWKEKGKLVIAPMSIKRAATPLFRCAKRVLFMSATMGDIPLFLKNLGIEMTRLEFTQRNVRSQRKTEESSIAISAL
jgi:Rad3-related DNA helicase